MRVLFSGALLALAACDENIEPPELDQNYTLWGAFDPTTDLQVIRVVPIRDTLNDGPSPPPDVTVHSSDLATGIETRWRDSLVSYDDGSMGNLYVAEIRPDYESRYRLRVTPPEGSELTAYIPVPPRTSPLRRPNGLPPSDVRYIIDWPKAPQLNAIRLQYTFLDPECRVTTLISPFPGKVEETETGWRLSFLIHEDSDKLLVRYTRERPADPLPKLGLLKLRVFAEVASETWRDVPADRGLLVQPGVFTNVENGFGFVGAAYADSLAWSPSSDEMRRVSRFYHPPSQPCG